METHHTEQTEGENEPLLQQDSEMQHQLETCAQPACTVAEEQKRPVVLYKGIQQREANQLQCPIHKGLMNDPVSSGKCKHVFCRSCLTAWVELQGHCPLDSRPVELDKLVPAQAVADKINALLIHCRWGLTQDPETGAWVPATGENGPYCPALVTIGDRRAHEDSCAYRPIPQQASGFQNLNMLAKQMQWPNMPTVNVDQVMHALKANLSRFERVLADRMDLFLVQMRSLLEEQNLHRIRSGASGAMTNFKEEMEAAVANLVAQAPKLRELATKSESLCADARDAARAKGTALYENAVQMSSQAAVVGGEAIHKLDSFAQEIISEVKQAILRSVEPASSCPVPPPPPPPDRIPEDEQPTAEEQEQEHEEEQEEQEDPEEQEESIQVHLAEPAIINQHDETWDDNPAWIPAQPTEVRVVRPPPRYPPPPPPRSSKPSRH